MSKSSTVKGMLILLLLAFAHPNLIGQNGIIKGKITNQINNVPLDFVNIIVLGTDYGAVSDLDGNYEITGVEPGIYDVKASFIGFNDLIEYEIQVFNNKPTVLNFEMDEYSTELEEVVVKSSPFKKTEESPVSLRTIGVAEIQRNPGANRDISKVVQSLPGVTTTANFRNDLIIRGGAPNENRFYLDDVEVPNINHFATQGASGGPVGLINVNFIREVDFYSGAFPANRGNTLSSVFNFKQRDGRTDRLGASFTVGASDVGLTFEGPIGDKTTFLFSARRSYLQFLFQALELPFLPTYNDFQLKVKHKFDQKNELTFIGLGAIDQFELNLEANETEEQQYLLNTLPVTPQWNYTNGLVYKRYMDNGYWTFVLSRNMLDNQAKKYANNDDSSEDNLQLRYQSQEAENKLRIENNTRINGYKINTGVGYEFVRYTNSTEAMITTPSGPQMEVYNSLLRFSKYYAFGQISKKFIDDRLSLSFGLRIDGNTYSDEMNNALKQLSPRFSASYALTDWMAVNFNTGRYFQLPPYTVMGYKENDEFINREAGIGFIQADHLVAGLEFNTNSSSKITIEGYYKKYSNYPFLLRDSISLANLGGDFGVIGNEPAISRSKGDSYGLEFLFQQRLYKGFYGIASYTLGKSQFDNQTTEKSASSWDSRHIVNLTLGKKFNNNWEVGVNWRFQSGLPYTPYADDSNLVIYWDVNNSGIPDYSQINSLRAAASNTLDLRVDKKWYFDKFSLNLYLDIENITGNAVGQPLMVLDKELDENGLPIGDPVIINPEADPLEWRYKTKLLDVSSGSPIPSIGIQLEI